MKKNSFQIVCLIILTAFVISCNKKDQSTPDPYAQLCTPTSSYYFHGIIGNQSYCWNYHSFDPNIKCQLSSGYEIRKHNDTIVACYWEHGIQKSVNNGFFESVVISSKTPYDPSTCTREHFFNSFNPGVYPVRSSAGSGDYPGFVVDYETTDTVYYTSNFGTQHDSQIELVSVIKKPDAGNVIDSAILHYRLRCTVYNPINLDSLRISISELTVVQLRLCSSRIVSE
jgi:hypothetical protein